MVGKREQEALEAYIRILRSKGASADGLALRESLLHKILPLLDEKECNGEAYREVVESIIPEVDKAHWPFFLTVIREFFRFWTGDIKAIAFLSAQSAFEIEPTSWQPLDQSLKSIWDKLDKEQFSTVEMWPIKAYTLALRQEGASKELVDTRVKLVKLVVLRLRDAPEFNNKRYRMAVDACLHLFEAKQTRDLFLAVVREFFYFWNGDPDAAQFIQIDMPDI